ncbi:tetratricopeptide repeat protein [Bizionia myxarmorum]|uniref:Tetratricopeptide repeat protein n=1 Tax=Bizionia myxarmorum TaxID=291186 RepID=A0A5D0RFQ6_9FLAO|nr:hypothetical protein [Bizionia myxarmorum]TYB79394.1 hypothetical protein ES674_06370 [Bizionia myxarmorum]
MNNQDLIYHYFSNSLTAEQEITFKKLLETDPDFKSEFDYENNLKKAIKSHESDALKTKLQGFESELKTPKNTNFKFAFLAIAASLLFLMGWFGYNSIFRTNYDNLYASNFTAYPNTAYSITRGDDAVSAERDAFVAYETKNYEKALDYFNEIPEADQKKYIPFYKAQSYLIIDNLEKAKPLFIQVVSNKTDFAAESTWYLALIAIKEKNKEQATDYLEKLIANYSYNQAEAKELLKKLN